ncbi:hypothetical protein [Mahella australiensis]|jgi:hypothetical protein|uniref:Uncharacterized protein n=1 Tax=Mahella australiensis (strain DSM 15567 / CIP 107919 / 50-1 BON) TaxID=697281 RepID=F3ZW85_MAHA5|nr:hypothetical protein [Mahella australiensis]AEE97494.1 hypothetical protein Mahau_2328 [Mahella australiensis 50-1 BON]
MTTIMSSMCISCTHYKGDQKCDAFPDGIPEEIFWKYADHRHPFKDDNDIRFQIASEYAEFEDVINRQYDKE